MERIKDSDTFMLRITIEIVPPSGPARPVGQVEIANDQTGTAELSNHNATVLVPTETGGFKKADTARVEGFERGKLSHFHLAYYAMKALLRIT
jgi:hypothetical protein